MIELSQVAGSGHDDAMVRKRKPHWLAALTSGEGYHNNHHGLPTSARFGSRPLDLDAAWWLIKVAEKMRLAEVRDVSAKKVAV